MIGPCYGRSILGGYPVRKPDDLDMMDGYDDIMEEMARDEAAMQDMERRERKERERMDFLTIEEALEYYELGYELVINDGKVKYLQEREVA